MKDELKKNGHEHDNNGECDLLYSTTSHMLTTETCGCAAAMMIIYRLKNKVTSLDEDGQFALKLAEEDFLAGQDLEWGKRNIRLWEILEYLVEWVGEKEFTAATLEVISVIADDERFDIRSIEGLTLVQEMEMIIHFARICVK